MTIFLVWDLILKIRLDVQQKFEVKIKTFLPLMPRRLEEFIFEVYNNI